MPVDFVAPILVLLTALSLYTGIVLFFIYRRVYRRVLLILSVIVIAIWPSAYVWLYDRLDIVYSRAAQRGDPEAEYRLGFGHMNYAQGTEYDPVEGRKLLEKSAAAGNAKAQMTLGCYLLSGIATQPNSQRAMALFDEAAVTVPDAKELAQDIRSHGFDVNQMRGIAVAIIIRWTTRPH
jgi:hypothetical protein